MTLVATAQYTAKPNVQMKISSPSGEFNFRTDTRHVPVFGRKMAIDRQIDQGYGVNKFVGSLSGFFVGSNHHEIVDQYNKLKKIVQCNDVVFTYTVDGVSVVPENTRVYIDDFDEPSDWKTYVGNYNIGFHWFEMPPSSITYTALSGLGIIATFDRTDPQPVATYKFLPTPNWAMKAKHVKSAWTANSRTPYGREKGTEIVYTLTGLIQAPSHSILKKQIEYMMDVFQPGAKGTLNYGDFSHTVRLYEAPEVPAVFPRNYCHYKLMFIRYTDDLFTFTVDKSYSRIHKFPRIRNRLFCKKIQVCEYMESGQTITYDIKCLAETPERARDIIRENLAKVIHNPTDNPAYELEGGVERELDNGEINVSIKKFHKKAVKKNTEDLTAATAPWTLAGPPEQSNEPAIPVPPVV